MEDYERWDDDVNDWETDQVYKDMQLDRDYEAERNAVVDNYDLADRAEGWPFIDPEGPYEDEEYEDEEALCCQFCGQLVEAFEAELVITPEGGMVACQMCISEGVRDRVRGPIAPPGEENE